MPIIESNCLANPRRRQPEQVTEQYSGNADRTNDEKENNVNLKQLALRALGITVIAVVTVGCGQQHPKPSNKIVLLLDGSITYKKRQKEAIERASALLESVSKQEVHRWEKGSDRIAVISLDAAPALLWEGNLKELKESTKGNLNVWADRLRARADYAGCTDVNAAFQLALEHLDGDPRYVQKYLFAYSDLQDEPPTVSLNKCQAPRRGPSEEFPWDSLSDVSVSIFWMPSAQILPWKRAIDHHQLADSFRLYSDSESATVTVAAPPRPKVLATAEDINAERANIVGNLKIGATVLLCATLLLVIVPLALKQFHGRPTGQPVQRVAAVETRSVRRQQPLPLHRRPTR
jgi:hypothetical protein